jgi:multicomponent K+:H+ antiporter subunit E
MKRWLPFPRLSVVLALLWLLLANGYSAGQAVLAIVLAVAIPLAVRRVFPPVPRIRRPWAALAYVWLVLGDILVANLRVARLVLGPVSRLRPRIVEVPLDVRDPVVASALAATVTLTPGTVSVELDPGRGILVVHALDAADDESVRHEIKTRYEARLKEIFEC